MCASFPLLESQCKRLARVGWLVGSVFVFNYTREPRGNSRRGHIPHSYTYAT